MKKLVIAATASALLVAGCAHAPPNTPGAGYGKNYTPVIDTLGVDQARYGKDLGDCRQYAGIIDADKAAMQGMIGGILVGALLGAAVGRNNGMTGYGANYGATVGGGAGLGAAANKATNQQERILINCMAGRGYRVLDGSAQASSTYPSPYLQGGSSVAAPTATGYGMVAPSNSQQYTSPPGLQPIQPPAAGAEAPKFTADLQSAGKDLIQAESFAASQSCSKQLKPWPAAMGPGFETYSASCPNSVTMVIRCEYGNCRALK